MKIDRTTIAFHAAERILEELESAGINYTDLESLYNVYNVLPEGMYMTSGASRFVFWDMNFDYVIKIAKCEEYERYNKREVEVYSAAVDEGLESNFAWCACYIPSCEDDDFYNPGVYVMEFLDGSDEEVSDSAWDYGYKQYCEERGLDSSSYDHADDYNDWSYDEDNETLMEFFLSQMDSKEAYEMDKFISKFHINDLHSSNYLFRNDSLVICDYAGWGW